MIDLTGELAAKLEINQLSSASGLVEVHFSSEWCSGNFNFFDSNEGLAELVRTCKSIGSGKKKGHWMSELGDLELTFLLQPSGTVRTTVVCSPSVNLTYGGRSEFTVDFDGGCFAQVGDLSA